MTDLEKDIASAKRKMVAAATNLLRTADYHNTIESRILDKIDVVAMCAALPGDMPLRVFCFHNAFYLVA
jgi:hypothetical protein